MLIVTYVHVSFAMSLHREAAQCGANLIQSVPASVPASLQPKWCSRDIAYDVQCSWCELCPDESSDVRRLLYILCLSARVFRQPASAVALAPGHITQYSVSMWHDWSRSVRWDFSVVQRSCYHLTGLVGGTSYLPSCTLCN